MRESSTLNWHVLGRMTVLTAPRYIGSHGQLAWRSLAFHPPHLTRHRTPFESERLHAKTTGDDESAVAKITQFQS